MKLLAFVCFLIMNHVWANSCPDRPVGFGISSLEELNDNLKSSYSVKEHCLKHKNIFSDFKNQKSDSDEMNKSVRSSKLIILGEEHLTPSQRDYGKLFSQLKKKNDKIDCLFLEFNSNDENATKLIEGKRPDSYIYIYIYICNT